MSKTNFCSGICKRIASSLRNESRKSRKTGIYLNDSVVKIWLQSILRIALPDYAVRLGTVTSRCNIVTVPTLLPV